jgi:hypothetical protein
MRNVKNARGGALCRNKKSDRRVFVSSRQKRSDVDAAA